jgi:disulfide bond formation protein DsbB
LGPLNALRARRRAFNILAALACVLLLAYAWYTQYYQGLEPCPLCIFQRVAVAALGIALLLAAAVPDGARRLGLLSAVLIGAVALAGIGVAARHLYIQSLPPGSVPACGATLGYLLDVFSVTEVLRKVLTGSGECAQVSWRFLGLSMPAWVLLWLLLLGTAGVLANWRPLPPRGRT